MKYTNLDTYTPLRIDERAPRSMSSLLSEEVPVGLGEPATTVVGPAIGNAIFACVRAWLPNLPIRLAIVLEALTRAIQRNEALTTIVAGPPWRWRFVASSFSGRVTAFRRAPAACALER